MENMSADEEILLSFEYNYVKNLIVPFIGLVLAYLLYQKFLLVRVLTMVMHPIHHCIHQAKKDLFVEAIKQIKSIKKDERPEVLEIGVGAGENFRYFPSNSNVHILDKTDEFLTPLKQSMERHERQDLEITKLIVEKAENMKDIESGSMDMVVHTFILCSVDDPKLVLSEIYRVLKPGGVCLFFEHSVSENIWTKFLQKFIGPLWFSCLDCKFKDMKEILKSGKYDSLKTNQHYLKNKLLFLCNPIIYGYGLKK